MDVCICGLSAIELWRIWRIAGARGLMDMSLHPTSAFLRNWKDCIWNGTVPTFEAPSEEWLARLTDTEELGLSAPVDVYVSVGQRRGFAMRKTSHMLPEPPPARSFVQIAEHIFATTPEYSLALACEKLNRAEAARLLFEFCGRYATDPGANGGFVACEPLTAAAELELFAAMEPGIRGAAALAGHLAYVCDGCASPMEAAMILELCLPLRSGGYGLPMPQANMPILPNDSTRPLMDRSYYVGDAVWPDAQVVAEYDSKAEHSHQAAVAHDNARRTALEALGYHVVNITLPTLANTGLLDKVAADLFKRLEKRYRRERFDPAWRMKQAELQKELLDVPLRWTRLFQRANGVR